MSDQTPRPQQVAVGSRLRRIKGALPEPVKASLRGSTRIAGLATARLRARPDFLIIGTKRGGTTSIWYALTEHPDVVPLFPPQQELKSPHYFDIHYGKGESWYRSFFATRQAMSVRSQRSGFPTVTGEASPYYMFHPLAAQRIARDLPDVKMIVSLRDPVDRLWSHYNERLAGGTETLGLQAALDAEPGRLAGESERIVAEQPRYYSHHHDLSSYLARGRYLEHLSAFLGRFSSNQLLVLRAEDFYEAPKEELDKVASFLGIRPFPPRSARSHYNRLPRAAVPEGVAAELVRYYRPHVQSLQSALDRDFRWRHF